MPRTSRPKLPGRPADSTFQQLLERVRSVTQRGAANQLDAMRSWRRLASATDFLEQSQQDKFYVLFVHPVHEHLNQTTSATKKEIIHFVGERVNPERMEGIDLFIAPADFSFVIVTNHDGDVFLATAESALSSPASNAS